jgi:hypothetical protein
VDASYTRSRTEDDSLYYPDSEGLNPGQYYAPSIFDAPNRFSLSFNYSLKGLNGGRGAVGYVTGGWGVSGTSIFQSGYPLTPENVNAYQPICNNPALPCPSPGNAAVGYGASSGDYLGDGDNLAYPDVVSYRQSHSNGSWLNGAIPKSDFSVPTFSMNGANGNEKPMQFRGPNFAETNINFYKDTHITERVNFQIRFEIFNFFNRANYVDFTGFSNILTGGVDMNLPDGTFGQATSSHEPRFWQLGGKLSF